MPLVFIAGTTAEVIKLAPVMAQLRTEGVAFEWWSTAQHVMGVDGTLEALGVPPPAVHLVAEGHRRHITAAAQVPGWASRVLWTVLRRRTALRRRLGPGPRVVVVHGDTFTTVLGAIGGRLLGARVGHVEAGMRTGKLLHPFPEEINRRMVAQLVSVHYAPTQTEAEHIRREHARGRVIVTGANTAVDALKLVDRERRDEPDLPERFGLVTLHRFELVHDAERLAETVRVLAEHSHDLPMLFVAGQIEKARIHELGLDHLFDGTDLRMIDKRPYAAFMGLLSRADFVVTDSGGLQQECAALGMPCAIHRRAVEERAGLGDNVVLTGLQTDALEQFLLTWPSRRRPATLDDFHPSNIIAADLRSMLSAPAG